MNRTKSFLKTLLPFCGLLFLFFLSINVASAQQTMAKSVDKNMQSAAATDSLYKRLGGYEALAAVTDEFIMRLATSKNLQRFVVGLSDDSKKKLRQHVVEFLCELTGGSCVYTARDMKTSHKGLGITAADWDEAATALAETLDKFKVGAREKNEVLTAVSSLKKDIVEMK